MVDVESFEDQIPDLRGGEVHAFVVGETGVFDLEKFDLNDEVGPRSIGLGNDLLVGSRGRVVT